MAPFTELADCLDQPAAEQVWRAIQERARANSEAYEKVFDFITQSRSQVQVLSGVAQDTYRDGFPATIWPTWAYRNALKFELGGSLKVVPPHQERFWLNADPDAPMGVTGFICALPVNWTKGEDNDSGFNLTILANSQSEQWTEKVVAQSESSLHKEHRS
ncbi:hypothetical protein [Pseudomonas xanthosomatis]|uniref:hypothetical protein n=1 Tax=Pseudomonas xanthosomatis TaxID=2842356 RepID=UPI0035154408